MKGSCLRWCPVYAHSSAIQHPTCLAHVHLPERCLPCVYAMIFVEIALLLRTFPFFPLQLRQMRKPYASLRSICLLVGFHDAFYDASSLRASIHSIQTMLLLYIAGCPSRLSGGPTRSVHASVLPSPVLTRAYSFRISSGRGGIASPVQRGAAHPRTNPAARAAGGEPPPLKAPRALRAPRKCRSSSGPGGRTPLSQLHRCGTVLGIRRSMSCCLGPASGSALVPDALPARAHTLTH